MNRITRRRGEVELERFAKGERLTDQRKIAAYCYVCSSAYDSGTGCSCRDCPCFPYNPYNKKGAFGRNKGAGSTNRALLLWAKGLNRKLGKSDLIKYYMGRGLPASKTIAATCIRCKAGYHDGEGCDDQGCPLIHSNPYIMAKKEGAEERIRQVGK